MKRVLSIRWRACCRPMAWGSPICARSSEQAVEARLARRARCRSSRRRSTGSRPTARAEMRAPGHRRRAHRGAARSRIVKYEGTDAPLVVALRHAATRSRPASRRRTGSASASSCRTSRSSSRRCRPRWSARPTSATIRSIAVPRSLPPRRAARARSRIFTDGRRARRRRSIDRDALRPGQSVDGPGDHPRGDRHHRGRARLARARSTGGAISCSSASRPLPRRVADRHRGRSGDARSLQQSLHGDRRADGRGAAEHRLFRQHQGAARFLLRALRPRRLADRQRAASCRCIWARWARACGPSSARGDATARHEAGRRLCAERAL